MRLVPIPPDETLKILMFMGTGTYSIGRPIIMEMLCQNCGEFHPHRVVAIHPELSSVSVIEVA